MSEPGPRTLLLLHPGAMGVTVGRTLAAGGHGVRWCAAGRSDATRQRADDAGFECRATLTDALAGAAAVVSVCPPGEALAVAGTVAASGFDGTYLDANAVAPETARRLEDLFGSRFVDGGLIGPPAVRAGTTRLYLSGPGAPAAAAWFAAGPLEARVLDAPAGAASALKMCYAAYTKGSAALLMAVRAVAEAEAVAPALAAEWALSQPDLEARLAGSARATAGKAWRFVDEMREIAATFEQAGLPGGFHEAAAEVYARMAGLEHSPEAELPEVIAALLARQRD